MKRIGKLAASALLGLLAASYGPMGTTLAQDASDKPFGTGSKAPELDIEHWVSNGRGAFKPVTKFEDGHVYVVEFWATWCGPCIASMPHLAETQDKYKDKKVQLISISDEDLETVNGFLEQEVSGNEEQTYGELTKAYCLTADPDRSVYKDYMDAAKQNGIPTAFIVGKKGLIEWIGHPMEMDEPLEQIVADKWDLEAAVKKFEVEMEAQEAMMKAQRALQGAFAKFQEGDFETGLKMLDKVIAETENKDLVVQLRGLKLNVLMESGAFEEAEIIPVAKEVLAAMAAEPMAINNIAWAISEKTEAGVFTDKAFLGEVAAIAEKAAAALTNKDEDWQVWDTAGHLYFQADNLDKAIETQKKAVANPNSKEAPEVAQFLAKLEALKK